ncbi:MAG: glucose-6-phosphate isomerase [Actinobacteria bacterium]|nr:glucose-6-phosphate isomerase [Actinomycetota bacterium]
MPGWGLRRLFGGGAVSLLEWGVDGSPAAMAPPTGLVERVWARDPSAWGPGEDDPASRLGWLDLPATMQEQIDDLTAFATEATADIDHAVLLGMGGSSLAPEMLAQIYGGRGRISLEVLDSTHPAQIAEVTSRIDPTRTLFLVSSKSGGTIETMSLYRYFRRLAPPDRFAAITDPGTSLQALGEAERFRRVFINPPDIGGRYSALSLFGLVPAALLGIDLGALCASASAAADECRKDGGSNPGLAIGAALAEWADAGRNKLTFRTSADLVSLGDWAEQLIAESTGKEGKGIAPIVGEPVLEAGYGPDRAFAHLSRDASPVETPSVALSVDASNLGGVLFVWEFATAIAGSLLGINAFDQPDVESAKRAAKDALASGAGAEWPTDDPASFFQGVAPGELACLLAFAPRSRRTEAVMLAARTKLVASSRVATSTGFGPRYLHSIGQLHKGGPEPVRALVILDTPTEDLPIPDSGYSFGRLIAAQAAGDASALDTAGRSVARTTWAAFESWART